MHDLAGDELGDGEPHDVGDARVEVVNNAPHLGCGQPVRLSAEPEHELVLSMVSTSKWMATREQPVPASQSSSGWVVARRPSGLKARMPKWATLAMSSSQPRRATRPTRPAQEQPSLAAAPELGGPPCPVNAATAMAWNPGYWLAGVPMSGWESIQTMARSLP